MIMITTSIDTMNIKQGRLGAAGGDAEARLKTVIIIIIIILIILINNANNS